MPDTGWLDTPQTFQQAPIWGLTQWSYYGHAGPLYLAPPYPVIIDPDTQQHRRQVEELAAADAPNAGRQQTNGASVGASVQDVSGGFYGAAYESTYLYTVTVVGAVLSALSTANAVPPTPPYPAQYADDIAAADDVALEWEGGEPPTPIITAGRLRVLEAHVLEDTTLGNEGTTLTVHAANTAALTPNGDALDAADPGFPPAGAVLWSGAVPATGGATWNDTGVPLAPDSRGVFGAVVSTSHVDSHTWAVLPSVVVPQLALGATLTWPRYRYTWNALLPLRQVQRNDGLGRSAPRQFARNRPASKQVSVRAGWSGTYL